MGLSQGQLCHMIRSSQSTRHRLNRIIDGQPSHIIITGGCLAPESLVALVLCTNYYYYDFVTYISAAAINQLRN